MGQGQTVVGQGEIKGNAIVIPLCGERLLRGPIGIAPIRI